MRIHRICTLGIILVIVLAIPISNVSASLTPATLNATLDSGKSVSETKTVFLLAGKPKIDVVFSFDLSKSMNTYFASAKSLALSIMTALDSSTVDAAFGVMSHIDYPHIYASYGYVNAYGYLEQGDFAYRLDQSLTSNRTAIEHVFKNFAWGCGGWEDVEDYERIIYESYSDSNVGWRECSKRVVVMFCDSLPHDDNLNEGMPGKTLNWSTGGDPGRDEVMFTSDDIDLQKALAGMTSNRISLLAVRYGWMVSVSSPYWQYWTGLTGGGMYTSSNGSSIAPTLLSILQGTPSHVNKLTLKTQPGYESWLTQVNPAEYTDIDVPPEGTSKTFNITITVPVGTAARQYHFKIIACADGTCAGEQNVSITVFGFVIPEFWMGPALGLIGCFAALGAFRLSKRRHT